MWRWARVILVPANTLAAQSKGIPIGNNSDLYPRWLGARELLLNGRDPYSVEVTREIQIGYYGRPLDPGNPADPKDQVGFAYPLYVVFLLAPAVTVPFVMAEEVFRWLLLLGIAASVPFWMRACGWRTRWQYVASGMLLTVSSSAGISEYYKQNLSALVVFFLAMAAAAAVRNWLVLSGFLLAFSTVKPQLSALFLLFFLLWAVSRWRERQRLLWSYAGTLLVLVLAAEAISPGWIGRFLRATREYEAYAGDPSILRALLPAFLAELAAAVLICVFLVLCWKWRAAPASSEFFAWALAWAGALTLVVLPKLASYNQPLLIPALLVLLAQRERIWKAGLLPRALTKGAFACQIWQWGTALILAVLSLLIPAERLRVAAGAPQYTLLAFPLMTLLALALATFVLSGTRNYSTNP